ncbi:DUF1524 domain-containing protein [Candidatus Mycosynbacter amalyticus]|uniref:DUF1524 domain-containing protein n=1 Tax=Candidatus Mycosynbacter amalyticus TaxID=2665156 RepID=A0A857MMW2_9BACT|nr:HNH endonuclease family protein [Candidatus Mycosynbacter amalyticus]QHN42912.1 DUF1524 domain-containing protein [Candidatus Mycosynbacter amalyticus]
MSANYKVRRLVVLLVIAIVSLSAFAYDMARREYQAAAPRPATPPPAAGVDLARDELEKLPVKGRAPKTGYARTQFGNGWEQQGDCDTRNIILRRDLRDAQVSETCKVLRGTLSDPYTGKEIEFVRGAGTSDAVQIDHVVALSNAWQTGAQQLTPERRVALANDPLELIAVDGPANQQKSDGDAATWLPSNKAFRCQYVARQIAVKRAYSLWVTPAEQDAIAGVLDACPNQPMPVQ